MTTIPADKLDRLVSRWETVQGALASGADQDTYVKLSREFAELDPIVATITALRSALREREDLQHLIDDPGSESEVAALAEEEIGPLGLLDNLFVAAHGFRLLRRSVDLSVFQECWNGEGDLDDVMNEIHSDSRAEIGKRSGEVLRLAGLRG